MAIFNGTPGADQIAGTNEDDIITGIGGADDINGADGNDDIDGGVGVDIIVGGNGDDTIDGGNGADNVDGEEGSDVFAAPDSAADTIDGGVDADGDDTDVLVTDLADGDDLVDGAMNVAGHVAVAISNIEEVKVTNASDFMIELGTDAFFGIDQTLTSTDYVATAATDADLSSYDGTTHAVVLGAVTHLESAGITINGTSYADGDTHTTANGGTVAITFNANEWELAYTALQQSSITANSSVEDEVLDIQITEAGSGDDNVVTVSVTLNSAIGNVIDLTGETGDFRIEGDAGGNGLTTGDGNDTVIGGDGADTIVLNDGDNIVWAGSADTGADNIAIDGDGNNEAWGGAGSDSLTINGTGANIIGGGADGDNLSVAAAASGANAVWGGAGNDTITISGDGDNAVGGGEDADGITIAGDGDNTIYGGKDADADDGAADTITISGDGDNTIYGGGADGDPFGNLIVVSGAGDNIIFNGAGDDTVDLSGATGDNTLYAGAGDDTIDLDAGTGNATVIAELGNGSDVLDNFGVAGAVDGTTKIDLSALGFTDADDVLSNMTAAAATTVTLFVTAGQVITFDDVSLASLQAADPADWLIL